MEISSQAGEVARRIVNVDLEKQFREGDTLAPLDCIIWCNEFSLSIPNWCVNALAPVFETYLSDSTLSFDRILTRNVRGRHTNPRVARRDNRRHNLIYAAVLCAEKEAGLRGDRKFEKAREILTRLEENLSFDTVKSTYKKLHKQRAGRLLPGDYFRAFVELEKLNEGG